MAWKTNRSAANAVTHGLTAKKLLPAELAAAVAEYRAALFAQLAPQNPLAEILVAGLARNAAAMQFAAEAETAALRSAQQKAHDLVVLTAVDRADAPYVAALSSELVEKAARYRRGHERSFFTLLSRWQEVDSETASPSLPSLFVNEDECVAYLDDWQRRQTWRCPECGGQKRMDLPARSAFQCRCCKKQYSSRWGTVLAQSHLPLLVWFTVIQRVVIEPQLTTAELAAALPTVRRATLAKVLGKVQTALDSADAERLLAGVRGLVLQRLADWAKCDCAKCDCAKCDCAKCPAPTSINKTNRPPRGKSSHAVVTAQVAADGGVRPRRLRHE